MTKFLILHGTGDSPESNWFMWLKGVLIGRGHKVWLPKLPKSEKPNPTTYNKLLLKNPSFKIDKDTVVIGHSSGAVAALYLLQHLPKTTKIKAEVLVGAFKDGLNWDSLDELFLEPLDFENIISHCKDITFIHSDNDPYCPIEHAQFLAKQTNGKLIIIEGQGHFSTKLGPQYKQFPEIINILDKII